jgi:ribosome maturation protein SDO1
MDMVSVDDAVIAKLTKENHKFEILVDCEKALALRKGEKVDISDVLASDMIFKDARKGERAADLEKVFGTDSPYDIAKIIIKSGDIQLTAEYRKKIQEQKKKQVINQISTYAVDTRTNKPIPPQRIELAMEQAGVHIDPHKGVEEQAKMVIDAIRPILPIRTEEVQIELIFPPNWAGKAYGFVQSLGKIIRDNWLNDGSWMVDVQIPAGMQDEFYDRVNSFTHGEVKTRTKKEVN